MSKKILFVTLHYLNGVGGGIFASRAFINAFANIFPNNVTLLYPGNQECKVVGIDSTVRSIRISNNKSSLLKLIDLLIGRVHRNFGVLPKMLSKEKFDYVIFDNSRVSYRMIKIAHRHGAKVITIHHNYEYEYNRDNTSGLIKALLLYWTRIYERQALCESDLNFVLTPQDKTLLTKNYNQPNKNIPIEVLGTFEYHDEKMPSLSPSLSIASNYPRFVITGNLSAPQTLNSILPWLDEYYPILKQEFPNSQLTIAGKKPAQKLILKCKTLGIAIVPSPSSAEMESIIRNNDIYICPTALGGGLKLRIMDGLKHGLPVITHIVSARGYSDFESNHMLFTYSDMSTFKNVCQKINLMSFDKREIQNQYAQIFSFSAGVIRLKRFLNI